MKELSYKIKNLHWTFISSVIFLSLVGLVMIYSASYAEGMKATYSQMLKLLLAIVIMFVVALINISFWQKYAYVIYFFGILLLIYATFYGYIGKGARRWIDLGIFNLQPSEIMKIFLVLALAKFFAERKIESFKDYLFFDFTYNFNHNSISYYSESTRPWYRSSTIAFRINSIFRGRYKHEIFYFHISFWPNTYTFYLGITT